MVNLFSHFWFFLLQNKSTDFDRENLNFTIICVQPKNLFVSQKTGLPSPLSVLMSSYLWVGPDYGLVVCESIVDYITCECFSFAPQCYFHVSDDGSGESNMAMTMMTMMNICERHELTRWPSDGDEICDEYFVNDVGGTVGNDNDDNDDNNEYL